MKSSEIQKARIAEIENKADLMLKEIKVATLRLLKFSTLEATFLVSRQIQNLQIQNIPLRLKRNVRRKNRDRQKNHRPIYSFDIWHCLSCIGGSNRSWAIRIFGLQLGSLVTAIRDEYSFCHLYFVACYCFISRFEEKQQNSGLEGMVENRLLRQKQHFSLLVRGCRACPVLFDPSCSFGPYGVGASVLYALSFLARQSGDRRVGGSGLDVHIAA